MICPHCKTQNEPGARYCVACGDRLVVPDVKFTGTGGEDYRSGDLDPEGEKGSFLSYVGQSGLKGYLAFFAVTFCLSVAGIIALVAGGFVSFF